MENNITKQGKREAWIHALLRKQEMRTLEEWDYETLSETIFRDDSLEFYRECQDTYGLENVKDGSGLEASLEFFLSNQCNLGEILHIDRLNGVTLLDYMAERDFPITFKTWSDDTPIETENRKEDTQDGKR